MLDAATITEPTIAPPSADQAWNLLARSPLLSDTKRASRTSRTFAAARPAPGAGSCLQVSPPAYGRSQVVRRTALVPVLCAALMQVLRDAATHRGCAWAAACSRVVPRLPRPRWTDDLIEAELRRLFAAHERWPIQAQFHAAGATGLLRAIYSGHGSRWWAKRIGVSAEGLRPRRSGRPASIAAHRMCRERATGSAAGTVAGRGPAGSQSGTARGARLCQTVHREFVG